MTEDVIQPSPEALNLIVEKKATCPFVGTAVTHREVEEKLTKLLGQDNLVGSSGEFGLLFTFLANKPGAKELDGEPALSLEDIESMFVRKPFPDGWKSWKKTRGDWVANTTALIISAGKAYLAQRNRAQRNRVSTAKP